MTNFNYLQITIPPEWAGRTIENCLRSELKFSRHRVRELKTSNGILLNNNPVWANFKLCGGEDLRLNLTSAIQNISPESIPLNIVYEDPDLVVVNKPAGMVVHPIGPYPNGTLANALVGHWKTSNINASFHPLHRLDRLTSGLILVAKNPWAHQQLALQMSNNKLHRIYLAICQGTLKPLSQKISAPIELVGPGFKWGVTSTGKLGITRYHVLKQNQTISLLAIRLFTGRTHQIRVHLSALGFPLIGDFIYGEASSTLPRPALHATRIHFIHPRTKQSIKLSAPLPDDLQKGTDSIN